MNRHVYSNTDVQACEKYCVFELGRRAYALLATSVREVGICPSITIVPGAAEVLAGLGHIRNEFVPILDFGTSGARTRRPGRENQVVVISGDHAAWAILVDRVMGLEPLEVSLRSDEGQSLGIGAAVMGTATVESRVVQVLDERALYRHVASLLNESIAAASS